MKHHDLYVARFVSRSRIPMTRFEDVSMCIETTRHNAKITLEDLLDSDPKTTWDVYLDRYVFAEMASHENPLPTLEQVAYQLQAEDADDWLRRNAVVRPDPNPPARPEPFPEYAETMKALAKGPQGEYVHDLEARLARALERIAELEKKP